MAGSDEVKEQLRRYEIVEWWYDGLNGKIIPWTTEHGNTSHDPSVQAFVLKADGAVLARAPNGQVYQPGSFSKWIQGQADDYDKMYPATRVPFLRSEVVAEDGGTDVRCPALDEAREAGRPVLAYFGRDEREGAGLLEPHPEPRTASTHRNRQQSDPNRHLERCRRAKCELDAAPCGPPNTHRRHPTGAGIGGLGEQPAVLYRLVDHFLGEV